jgi:prepilin-type N-terminal cleavage/methylation domain-containing protein
MKTAQHRKQKAESRKQKAECGARNPVSRNTQHAIRNTPPAFTLVELLVVIAMIAVLAALTFPAVSAAKISIMRSRARAELTNLETAIERYHDKLGYYPPDNPPIPPFQPADWAVNQLYYELLGTTNSSGVFHTLDDSDQIAASLLPGAFGAGSTVTGFMNCSRGGEDGLAGGVPFVKGLKATQFQRITNQPSSTLVSVLGTSLDGPLMFQSTLGAKLNPWRYNSSSPQHNPKTYDLWIDVMAGSKTNRICNWSDKYIIIGNPQPAYPQ